MNLAPPLFNQKSKSPEAPSNSFCLCIFGPAGSHGHPYLEGGWTEDWWTRCVRDYQFCHKLLRQLMQVKRILSQNPGAAAPPPTCWRQVQWKGSGLGVPTPHLSCHCPTPSHEGPRRASWGFQVLLSYVSASIANSAVGWTPMLPL